MFNASKDLFNTSRYIAVFDLVCCSSLDITVKLDIIYVLKYIIICKILVFILLILI